MAKIVVSEFLTLDGVYQGPGDANEDRSGGFTQGGWQLPFFDDLQGSIISDGMANSGGFLLGRRTYEIFAAYWPNQPADDPLAAILNGLPKHVASTTLSEPLAWQNSNLINRDVATEVAKLKEQPGKDIQVIGSGELVRTLMQHDLVNVYQLMIHPIVLGSGRRLFRDGSATSTMRLVDSKTSTTGVLIVTYEPARTAGEATTASGQ